MKFLTHGEQQTFMAAGSLTLGGNLSIALGPLGRNGEAIGSLNTSGKVAAMYSYSKTRGLFGGISVEGSVIVERQDANHQAYHSPVTARMLLGGVVEPPDWASFLIQTLESCTGMPGGRKWVQDGRAGSGYAFGSGLASPSPEQNPPLLRKKKNTSYQRQSADAFPPNAWGNYKNAGSYFESEEMPPNTTSRRVTDWDEDIPTLFPFDTPQERSVNSIRPRLSQSVSYSSATSLEMSYDNPAHSTRYLRSQSEAAFPSPISTHFNSPGNSSNASPYNTATAQQQSKHVSLPRAIALYDFSAIEVRKRGVANAGDDRVSSLQIV
ncbi:hypothetical protein H0H87_010166 [Tephrocybe sp. NHM501043]|nr:hypothetical protein H0H87_010166 [Tephrocybe sp. NHM501043]